MNNRKSILQTLLAAALVPAAGLLAAACANDDAAGRSTDMTGKPITFSVGLSDTEQLTRAAGAPIALQGGGRELWLVPSVESTAALDAATRGTQLNKSDKLSSFGVSAFRHAADDDDLSDDRPDYFYNLEATEAGTAGLYQIAQNYYWPSADEALTFQAYYPYGNDNVKLTDLSSETKNTGAQSFSVTVAGSAKEQVDFMTAEGTTTDFTTSASPGVSLKFKHHMTALRFVIGDQFPGGYIKSINITGIYGKGTYTVGSGWTLKNEDKSAVNISYMTGNTIDKEVEGTSGEVVTAANETFLLIPQEFTADDEATISVLFHDGKDDYVVSASLAGQDAWQEGTTITYSLSSTSLTTLRISDINFAATPAGAPKTGWVEGDCVGMYVVNANGATIDYKNVKVEYVGGSLAWKWKVHQPVEDGVTKTIYHRPGQVYYFYYPYKEGTPEGYPLIAYGTDKTAEEFFSAVIGARNNPDTETYPDQSDVTKWNAADLQVAKATAADYVSTVAAAMQRQVGLARVQLNAPVDIYKKKVYTNNSLNTTTSDKFGKESIAATSSFLTNQPCPNSGLYWFFTRKDVPTTINSIQTDVNTWQSGKTFTLTAGETSEVFVAKSVRNDWEYVNELIYEYNKTGSYTDATIHTFTIPVAGNWLVQCWGAGGGKGTLGTAPEGGIGAYTEGTINLTKSSNSGKFYVYIGGRGTDGYVAANNTRAGGYNGGGYGRTDQDPDDSSGGGGGATDIRLNTSTWGKSNRIMVAAGGGGGCGMNTGPYTKAGINGGTPNVNGKMSVWSADACWTAVVNQSQGNAYGQGENGTFICSHAPGGGGGGYMGGVTNYGSGGKKNGSFSGAGSGGSSYISGNASCTAISGFTFSGSKFISGASSTCPSKTIGGSAAAMGRENGYARFTLSR